MSADLTPTNNEGGSAETAPSDGAAGRADRGEALLVLDRVAKSYGKRLILEDVSFEVHPGEIVAIIGPSGAGKSTMLRSINQIEPITGGTITFEGRVIARGSEKQKHINGKRAKELSDYRRSVGLVFQNFQLFPHLTALENVVLAQVHALGRNKTEARQRGTELLQMVGLGHIIDKHPSTMSGGEQQRAAIARALALDPKMLLFDEPTSAIDPERRRDVLNVLRDLAAKGMTMMIVTHEIQFAVEVAERLLFMADGGVVEDGTPEQILHAPRDERTKSFIEAVTYEAG